jgi:hypothetical protein
LRLHEDRVDAPLLQPKIGLDAKLDVAVVWQRNMPSPAARDIRSGRRRIEWAGEWDSGR